MTNYIKCSDARTIIDEAKKAGNDFLHLDFKTMKEHKSKKGHITKYIKLSLITPDGNKPLRLHWNPTKLCGSVKPPTDRKYGAQITFRKSSKVIGGVICDIYEHLEELVAKYHKKKLFKIRSTGRSNFSSIIRTQSEDDDGNVTEFDEPLIRFKLLFFGGKAKFTLTKIVKKKGRFSEVPIKFNESDVHEILRYGSTTSGIVDITSVRVHSFGISAPAEVRSMVVNTAKTMAPSALRTLDENELNEMHADESGDDSSQNDEPENHSDDDMDPEEALESMAKQ